MSTFRRRASLEVRERIFKHYHIPFSRFGLNLGLLRHFRPSNIINYVDIGASEGQFAYAVDQHYGVNRGILIEPQPLRCSQLSERFAEPRFSICQCALSDREATCEMEVFNWDFSSSILPVRRDISKMSSVLDLTVKETITCRTTMLDTLLREEADFCGTIDLIKIDVQGAELMVFRGAEESLRRTRFVLTEVSFSPLYEGACIFGQVYDFLCGCGLRLLSITEGFRGADDELLECDALFGR